jgi:formamidopyrimidine-DNA glycosylase
MGIILPLLTHSYFGKIAVVENMADFITQRGYGEDALFISKEKFIKRFGNRKIPIKTVLINQKIIAGVGNEFSDEILFQWRIHPMSVAGKPSEKQLVVIYKHMKEILREAVRVDADRERLLQYFFLEQSSCWIEV